MYNIGILRREPVYRSRENMKNQNVAKSGRNILLSALSRQQNAAFMRRAKALLKKKREAISRASPYTLHCAGEAAAAVASFGISTVRRLASKAEIKK